MASSQVLMLSSLIIATNSSALTSPSAPVSASAKKDSILFRNKSRIRLRCKIMRSSLQEAHLNVSCKNTPVITFITAKPTNVL